MDTTDALISTAAPSDGWLVQRLVEGSDAALATLYERHTSLVFAVALRLVGDRTAAEEIVQEAFLALWNRAELFDPARGSLATWLLAITRNRSIDHLRSRGRRMPSLAFSSMLAEESDDASPVEWLIASGRALGVGGDAPGPEASAIRRETRAVVVAAIEGLGDTEREVIRLAYGDGLSQSEIAARLAVPLGTVKTRTRRALLRLRAALEGSSVSRPDQRPADETARAASEAASPSGVDSPALMMPMTGALGGGPDRRDCSIRAGGSALA